MVRVPLHPRPGRDRPRHLQRAAHWRGADHRGRLLGGQDSRYRQPRHPRRLRNGGDRDHVRGLPRARPCRHTPHRNGTCDRRVRVVTELLAAADAATWRDRDAELISPAYHRYSDLVVESAEGAHLHPVDGRDVLDFGCGIGVTNLGHRHPAVVAAVHEQVDRLWHTSVTAFHPKMIEAAAAIVSVTPPSLDQVFLTNSGAEAVEGAMKLARRATGRSEIIAFVGGFHGRTYGALSLTASKATYRRGMGPLLPGIHHIRYPYCFRYCTHPKGAACDLVEHELLLLFLRTTAPETVAAIIVEPVQGEGGYVVPPATFMPMLRRVCNEHGILLVADEVQSGFARTGKMFAVNHTRLEPDIMCVAKAL